VYSCCQHKTVIQVWTFLPSKTRGMRWFETSRWDYWETQRHNLEKNGIHIKYCFSSQAFFVSRKVIWSSGLIFYVSEPSLHEVSTAMVTFIRFCITITNFVCYLQGMEIFPTCLRQTGMSIANLAGNMAGVLAPYVVYLVRNPLFLLKYLHFMQTYLLNC